MPDREKVIKEWEAVLSRDPLDAPWDLIDDTLALLKEQELVRCKDCKNQYYDLQDGRIVCGRVDNGEIHTDDWFCADGERKEVK